MSWGCYSLSLRSRVMLPQKGVLPPRTPPAAPGGLHGPGTVRVAPVFFPPLDPGVLAVPWHRAPRDSKATPLPYPIYFSPLLALFRRTRSRPLGCFLGWHYTVPGAFRTHAIKNLFSLQFWLFRCHPMQMNFVGNPETSPSRGPMALAFPVLEGAVARRAVSTGILLSGREENNESR